MNELKNQVDLDVIVSNTAGALTRRHAGVRVSVRCPAHSALPTHRGWCLTISTRSDVVPSMPHPSDGPVTCRAESTGHRLIGVPQRRDPAARCGAYTRSSKALTRSEWDRHSATVRARGLQRFAGSRPCTYARSRDVRETAAFPTGSRLRSLGNRPLFCSVGRLCTIGSCCGSRGCRRFPTSAARDRDAAARFARHRCEPVATSATAR